MNPNPYITKLLNAEMPSRREHKAFSFITWRVQDLAEI